MNTASRKNKQIDPGLASMNAPTTGTTGIPFIYPAQEVALAGAKGFASSLAWVVPIPLSDYETSSSATALALSCGVN